MQTRTPTPLPVQLAYACGIWGVSILTNIVTVMLIYFYVPPSQAGLDLLIPQTALLAGLTALSLIAAGGRLFDAVTDPIIAYWSDRTRSRMGRRRPFMLAALVPSVIFCVGLFVPVVQGESYANAWQLAFMQTGFFLFLTAYIIPYNALLPQLAQTPDAKIWLSMLVSLGFVLGIIVSSQTPALADVLERSLRLGSRAHAIQYAIVLLSVLAGLLMLVPILVVREDRYGAAQPINISLRVAVRQILANRNFLIFVVADCAYFVSLTIISSGLLYFLTVLLDLDEAMGGPVMGVLVVTSLLFYPAVVRMARHYSKAQLMFWSLLLQGLLLFSIYFMGKITFFSAQAQIFGFAALCALPAAFLGILPYAVIADIAREDTQQTGQQKEALFFAVRNLATKSGQTLGIMLFAALTRWGKDPGDDLGIRLSAAFAAVLCVVAAFVFLGFKEVKPQG